MKLHRSLIAVGIVGASFALTAVAGATPTTADLSPEYTWTVGVPELATSSVPVVAIVASVPVEARVAHSSAPADSESVAAAPAEVVHEMTDPIGYTGPSFSSGIPGGEVVTDHPVVALPGADQRVVHCAGARAYGQGGTFPAASVSQPGLVDLMIAEGTCTVVG